MCKNLKYFPLRYYFPFAFSGMLPLDFQGPIEKKTTVTLTISEDSL